MLDTETKCKFLLVGASLFQTSRDDSIYKDKFYVGRWVGNEVSWRDSNMGSACHFSTVDEALMGALDDENYRWREPSSHWDRDCISRHFVELTLL